MNVDCTSSVSQCMFPHKLTRSDFCFQPQLEAKTFGNRCCDTSVYQKIVFFSFFFHSEIAQGILRLLELQERASEVALLCIMHCSRIYERLLVALTCRCTLKKVMICVRGKNKANVADWKSAWLNAPLWARKLKSSPYCARRVSRITPFFNGLKFK